MIDKLKIGLLLPTRRLLMTGDEPGDFDSVLALARAAEEGGLDSVWVGDSLTAKPRLEPLSTLAAVAARTTRVRLGTAVLLAALRQPVLLAHAAATVDFISGGRLVLGVGVGGAFNDAQRQEWHHAGVEPSHRARRLEEIVTVVKQLTRGERVSFHGRHFDLDSVEILPRSPQPNGVPLLLACHWRAGIDAQVRRAARLGDGFISISDYPDEYALLKERVDEHTTEAGGDPASHEAAFYMTVNLGDDASAAANEADEFLRFYYGMNMWGDRWGPYGPADLTAQRIRSYQEAGAGTVIVRFAAFDQRAQLDTFLERVVPAF